MNVLVLSASPNKDGLTAACAAAAVEGARQAGGHAEEVRLNDLQVGMCQACDNGWGTCLKDHECQVEDDFQALHGRMRQADAYVLVTPVYWGEMSESAKSFTDRLRRCEATRGDESGLSGKPAIAVAMWINTGPMTNSHEAILGGDINSSANQGSHNKEAPIANKFATRPVAVLT